jgi:hypothetical protein
VVRFELNADIVIVAADTVPFSVNSASCAELTKGFECNKILFASNLLQLQPKPFLNSDMR